MKTIIEPFRIKGVEPIQLTKHAESAEKLTAENYNLFALKNRAM